MFVSAVMAVDNDNNNDKNEVVEFAKFALAQQLNVLANNSFYIDYTST